MLSGIVLSVPVSALALLCSPFFGRFTHHSGLLQRALSHLTFLAVYLGLAGVVGTRLPVDTTSVWAWEPIGLMNGGVVYVLLFTVSEMVFGKIERSVSLRIIAALTRDNSHKGLKELEEEFEVERMIAVRVDGLRRHGYIIQHHQQLLMTPKGRRAAAGLRWLRMLFAANKSLTAS